jgi:hypothetical protein
VQSGAGEHVDQPVDLLELQAIVTRLMLEKDELRRELQDFRAETLAMMGLLRREIEAGHGPAAAPADPAPADVVAAPAAALADAAATAAPPMVPTHPPRPAVSPVVRAALNNDLAEPKPTTSTTPSVQTFASTTARRVRPAVVFGPQLIDEWSSEAEAAWNAVIESSRPTVVGVEGSDAGPRLDLSDL